MSETQTKFEIWSYGRCGRSYVEILWPKKLDSKTLIRMTSKPGEYVLDLGFAVLNVANNDSRKNYRRVIVVQAKEPMVIRSYGCGSCNPRSCYDHIYLLLPDGSKAELELKTEIKHQDNEMVVTAYVIHQGMRIEVERYTVPISS